MNIYERIETSLAKQQFSTLLGIQLEAVEEGFVSLSCKKRDDLTQQHGFLHAGVTTTLADSACGYAALTTMEEGDEVLSVEFKINLLRPAVGDEIRADAKVIKAGKTLTITEATVYDIKTNKEIAKMQATMVRVVG
ncbi:PaaI family thioesterase [Aerococcus agrisoli]|uniref:PaaI family thioesterase n=1 Tax=Aerococcus agrisoli TaxID=2487350 RepID=A0A3N4G1E5_9LACT|nr:PaaI family thioesterase [Aerococcus agrisoli]RPA56783.1 PaaI family thioesterase [Aerococcus agrisoli]